MPDFINGLDLSQRFYEEGVEPLLSTYFSTLTYSAALIGAGSEILRFDTPQSTDHDWGPRLILFLAPEDLKRHATQLDQFFQHKLPTDIHGYSTHFGGNKDGTAVMSTRPHDDSPIKHKIKITTLAQFCQEQLQFNPLEGIRPVDWLTTPDYRFLALTSGRLFYDGLNQLAPLRARLAYYPHEIWLYQLAAQWQRISQEEAFMGRCGQVGDELGSQIIAARLVKDVMRLCFLMARRYAPYIKWFGSAFAQLPCADKMHPQLMRVLQATDWQAREEALTAVYQTLAQQHNTLQITPELDPHVTQFHNRPFMVIHAGRFVSALRAEIKEPAIRAFPPHLGATHQFIDSTDGFSHAHKLDRLYQ